MKIFCTLGSSGKKEYLFEAIQALNFKRQDKWSAVVLAPPAICSLEEARAYVKNNESIYITDQFVPAPLVNKMADLIISHGGQGTVQTAIASGTPIIGFAMQPEQQINLDHIVSKGAAIRLPIHQWKAKKIHRAIIKILQDKSYKQKMKVLMDNFNKINGKENAAKAVWEYILSSDYEMTS